MGPASVFAILIGVRLHNIWLLRAVHLHMPCICSKVTGGAIIIVSAAVMMIYFYL